MRQNLIPPVVARWFRVHPVTWEVHCSLRLELIGCQNRLHGKLSNNDSAYTVCMYNIKHTLNKTILYPRFSRFLKEDLSTLFRKKF